MPRFLAVRTIELNVHFAQSICCCSRCFGSSISLLDNNINCHLLCIDAYLMHLALLLHAHVSRQASTHLSPPASHTGTIGYSKIYAGGKSKQLAFETCDPEQPIQVPPHHDLQSPQEDGRASVPGGGLSSMSGVITGINISSDTEALKQMLKEDGKVRILWWLDLVHAWVLQTMK